MKWIPNFNKEWQRTAWVFGCLIVLIGGFYFLSPTNYQRYSYYPEIADGKITIQYQDSVLYIKEENVEDENQNGVFFLDSAALQIKKTDGEARVEVYSRGLGVAFKEKDDLSSHVKLITVYYNPQKDEIHFEQMNW